MADKNTEMTEQEAYARNAEVFGDGIPVDAGLEHEQPIAGVGEENAVPTDSLPDSSDEQRQDTSSVENDEAVTEADDALTQQGTGESIREEDATGSSSDNAPENNSEQIDEGSTSGGELPLEGSSSDESADHENEENAELQSSQNVEQPLTDDGSSDYEVVPGISNGTLIGEGGSDNQGVNPDAEGSDIYTLSRDEFITNLNDLTSARKKVDSVFNTISTAFDKAKNIKGVKKSVREERKQAIENLKNSLSAGGSAIIDAEEKIYLLNSALSSPVLDASVSEGDKTQANNVISATKESIANVNNKINEANKWLKRRAIIKSIAITGLVLGAATVVGAIGEIPEAWGNDYYQFARTTSNNGGNSDSNTNITIDVDSMDVIRIQNILDKTFGNSTINVQTIKTIQVDSNDNFHLILDADKKGTDCLIDINIGEQAGFTDTTTLVNKLEELNLTKNDVETYYELSSFVGKDSENVIAVDLENQLGEIGATSGGIWAKGAYSIDRSGKASQYSAKVDYLVFDGDNNATKIDGAVTLSSTKDFKNNLWNVVCYSYGGSAVDFSGKISQDFTKTSMSKASVSIVNSTGTVAVSTGLDLVR